VFAAVVEEAGKVLGVDGVRMLRREADGTATVIANWGLEDLRIPVGARMSTEGRSAVSEMFDTGRIAWADSFSGPEGSFGAVGTKLGVRLAVAAPITVEGRVWGAMGVVSLRPLQPEEIGARLVQFTDLAATAIANSQAREDLAASRMRLVAAGDETRRRIERDLHDGIQQRLVSLMLELRIAEAGVPDELSELREQLSQSVNELGGCLDELREVSRGIHPAILSEGGLRSALKALARRSAVPVHLDVDIPARPGPGVEAAAYYVVAEALTNATKHANASVVGIDATDRGDRLEISIVDDGVGGADPTRGTGLVGLIDRVDALGGRIAITSPRGEGTQVRVELPIGGDRP
jgi:signal transduction histidine kinase